MKMPVTAENNYNRNKNVIVFGPSGSGKSYCVAGPQLLQFNSNYVLSDPKGELLDTYGNVLLSQGYDVKVFNLKDRDKSDHYNPFAYIHDTDDIVVVVTDHRGAASWTIYSKIWPWKSLRHSQRVNMDCTTWHRTKPHRVLMYLSVCV